VSESVRDPASDDDRAALVALAGLPGIGPTRLRALATAGPAEMFERLRADRGRPATVTVGEEIWNRWRAAVRDLDPREVWSRHVEAEVGIVVPGDEDYPGALRDDREAPAILFHRGDPRRAAHACVSIVGTRRSTGYGEGIAHELGRELAAGGVTVVSGLALGIDGAAHAGAVSVDGAAPVAVVANGLDITYPRRNRELWRAVERVGCIWSESPLGVAPERWRFPARNRIIAALSPVLVVVESGRAGGSMHTVREADDRGRTVMAVPGSVRSPASAGPNQLLSEGCAPCRDVDDVTTALGLGTLSMASPPPTAPPLSDRSRHLLEAFEWAPATVDQLVVRSGLGVPDVSGALAELVELGLARSNGASFERVAR
jgi:DNA processing protein